MDTDKTTEKKQELETLLRQTQGQLRSLQTQEQRVIGALALLQELSVDTEKPVKRAKR